MTGSAHAVAGPWWGKRLGKTSLKARQCSARGGDLRIVVEESGERVRISGGATLVSKGKLFLPISL